MLGDSLSLVVVDALPALQLLHDRRQLVGPILRNQQRDRTPDDLSSGVAIESFGPTVPIRDDALEALADDRVVGRFDHRCQTERGHLDALALVNLGFERRRALL